MSSFVSRWVVAERRAVAAADLDADGIVRDDAVVAWIGAARDAYLERCAALRARRDRSGLVLRCRDGDVPAGRRLGRPAQVVVSAGATELRPDSFTMAFRLRTYGSGDDVVVNATCIVSLDDPVTGSAAALDDAIRDELIALEHAARYTN